VSLSVAASDDVGGQPLAGVAVGVDPDRIPDGGWNFGVGNGTTDAQGRFQRTVPANIGTIFVSTKKAGYAHPCLVTVSVQGDTSVDIQLTQLSNLALFNAHPQTPPGTRSVSGVVFEQTAGGAVPIAGAWVGFEYLDSNLEADTFTEAAGGYVLCGLPVGTSRNLGTIKDGYHVTDIPIGPGQDSLTVNVELKRY
jgi:hypothetical protein